MFRRQERLAADAAKTEEDLSEEEKKYLKSLKKQGYLIDSLQFPPLFRECSEHMCYLLPKSKQRKKLQRIWETLNWTDFRQDYPVQGRIGRTFLHPDKLRENRTFEFDAEALSFSAEEEPAVPSRTITKKVELSHNEVKDARWFYDTPGIIRDCCVLNLLTDKEIKLVLPTRAIVPRTFVLKPGFTLFLGALGRIDYLEGDKSAWFSVVASNLLPVHITMVEKADAIYEQHAGCTLLKVPMGGNERMKDFPSLVPQDVMLEGIGDSEAVADIKLSSAGWVAITAPSNNKMHLRCYTPEGTLLTVRKPPLLPYVVQIKGERVKKSSAYKTIQPTSFVENLNTTVKNEKMASKGKRSTTPLKSFNSIH